MKRFFLFLILFSSILSPIFANITPSVGVSEEMQVRLLQLDNLPLIFTNVIGMNLKLQDKTNPKVKYILSGNVLLPGVMLSLDNNDSVTERFALGGGVAFSSRLGLGIFSIKSELSGLYVGSASSNLFLTELGVDLGFWFSIGKSYDILIDIVRMGMRPTGDSWIPGYDGPFFVSSYPSLGIVLYL